MGGFGSRVHRQWVDFNPVGGFGAARPPQWIRVGQPTPPLAGVEHLNYPLAPNDSTRLTPILIFFS